MSASTDDRSPDSPGEPARQAVSVARGIVFDQPVRWLPLAASAILGLAMSGALSLQRVGVLPGSLPGCSAASGCASLTQSTFGSVPWVGWSWAHVGTAWFAALLVGVLVSPRAAGLDPSARRKGVGVLIGPGLRWAGRLGAMASAVFIGLMIWLGALCPWCLGSHVGSVLFWLLVARSDRRRGWGSIGGVRHVDEKPTGTPPVEAVRRVHVLSVRAACAIAVGIATTVGLGVLEYRHAEMLTRAAREAERAMARAIAGERGEPPVDADAELEGSEEGERGQGEPQRDRLGGRHALGAASGRIEIVVFSDYECPDCRRIDEQIGELLARADVTVLPRHFPLCSDCNRLVPRSLHPDACRRALLAEAAGALGGSTAFAAAHRALFALQAEQGDGRASGSANGGSAGSQPRDPVDVVLEATGLDRAALLERMTSDEVRAAVAADIEDAVALGVTFTPMVFVNGVEWKWYRSRDRLRDLVDRVSAAAGPMGVPPSAAERLVDEWRAGARMRAISAEERALAGPQSESSATAAARLAGQPIPQVDLWLDYTTPATATLLRELDALAAEGVVFRRTDFHFPVSSGCNELRGLGSGRPESCLGALIAAAAGIVAGPEARARVADWLVAHGDSISLESLLPTLDALDDEQGGDTASDADGKRADPPAMRSAVLAAFGDGRALDRVQRESSLLWTRTMPQSLPAVVVNDRLLPRWEHPGAPPREVLRLLIESAAREMQRAVPAAPAEGTRE